MARKKDDVERLEAEVRELKAVNRSLTKRIKKINRGYRKEREEENKSKKKPREDESAAEEIPKRSCPECHVGEIVERVILDRHWQECSKCERRTKTKII